MDNGFKRAKVEVRWRKRIKPDALLAYWKKNGIDPWKCFYTGAPLVREPGHPNSREIDHVEPLSLKGSTDHVMKNIVPCSHEWNRYKYTRRAVNVNLNAPEELQPVKTTSVWLMVTQEWTRKATRWHRRSRSGRTATVES